MGGGAEINKAVFLDRDGILTTDALPPKSPQKIKLNPIIPEFLDYLAGEGFLIFCVSNQPDVARGTLSKEQVQEINDILWVKFPKILKFDYCPHDDPNGCVCRKPKPGMLIALAKEYEVDLAKSWMVGDRWRDVGAGQNAGCKTILVGLHNDQPCTPDFHVKNIKEIIKRRII